MLGSGLVGDLKKEHEEKDKEKQIDFASTAGTYYVPKDQKCASARGHKRDVKSETNYST